MYRDRLEGVRVRVQAGVDASTSIPTRSGAGAAERRAAVRHGHLQVQGPHRAGHAEHRAGHHQRHHQGRSAASRRRSTSPRATARRTPTSSERDGYSTVADGAEARELRRRQAGAGPDRRGPGRRHGRRRGRPDRPTSSRPKSTALKAYSAKNGKLLLMLDPPDRKPTRRTLTSLIALAHDWGMDVGNNIVVDASGMGRLIGTDASVPVAASYPSHPITERFNVLTAYPLARSRSPRSTGGVDGHTAQTFVESSAAQLGGSRHQGAARLRRSVARRGQGRQAGPGVAGRGRLGQRAAGRAAEAGSDTRRAEAGDARRGVRRFRLRRPTACSAFRATATCS